MKKTYIAPDMLTVKLAVKRTVMLVASQNGLSDTTKEEWNPEDEVDW